MAGFDFSSGCSNNMLAARDRGMVNAGIWGKRYRVSAAAVMAVMEPTEAHHTGTGHRGRSRLTPVLPGDLEPTAEQVAAMREFDRAAREAKAAPVTILTGCTVRYLQFHRYARTRAGRRPDEVIDRDRTVELRGGAPQLKMLPGLVLVGPDGQVLVENVNSRFESATEIAARIAPRANSAGPAGDLVAATAAAGSITRPTGPA